MTPIKRTYGYVVRKRNGELRLRVHWGVNRVMFGTGFHVDKEKFRDGRCVRGSFHGRTPGAAINRGLEELENKIDLVFCRAEFEDREVTPDALRALVRGGKAAAPDIWATLEQFVAEGERQRQWAFNTVKSVRQVIKLLRKFDAKLTFGKLTPGKLDEFVVFQQSHKLSGRGGSGQAGYTNSMIVKNCRVVRWMLRWAAEKGYVDREVERGFRPSVKTVERPVIFLRWEELMRVYNLDLAQDRLLEEARDFFCFCCFTSLRFSDAHGLMPSQIKNGCIEVLAQKTGRMLRIELNKYSRAIIERNKGKHGGYALPHVSVSKLDYRLPRIGELAGIDEPVTMTRYYGSSRVAKTEPKYKFLTSHCGRRTFICNALSMGIAPSIVMKWTGHSEYSAMKPYIDIADEIKTESMGRFDER